MASLQFGWTGLTENKNLFCYFYVVKAPKSKAIKLETSRTVPCIIVSMPYATTPKI